MKFPLSPQARYDPLVRLLWLIATLALVPSASLGERAITLGVGELSCSREIEEPLCDKLTERLVAALEEQSQGPVVRQSAARKKQRACKQDPACMVKHRTTYEKIVSGTVRNSEQGVAISLRLLDAKRMEKLAEAISHASSAREVDLLQGIDAAAADLLKK